jgi:hypothetical protein
MEPQGTGNASPFRTRSGNAERRTVRVESQLAGTPEQSEVDWEHVYVEGTLKNLVQRVPELKGIRPAADQNKLEMVLKNTGENVDEFFTNLVHLIARKEITQERLNDIGRIIGSERVKDNYLILRHAGNRGMRIDEYRMDAKGNRMDYVGLDRGLFVTSGFALSCMHFSSGCWRNSTFRYLGDQKMEGRVTDVVAFTQLPGADANRLLAPQREIGLEEQTTTVKFSELRIADMPNPLWLPREVDVYIKFQRSNLRYMQPQYLNKHRYTNYRRYRVTIKMIVPTN